MQTGALTQYLDVAQVVLYVFWVFFAGLIFYLRQEDRREGYPLEHDFTGKVNPGNFLFIPPAKTFNLAHGHGTASAPNGKRETRELKLRRTVNHAGAAYEPTSANPMRDGVGPGSYAERQDFADVTLHGAPRIAPLRLSDGYGLAENDPAVIGMPVIGCDNKQGGVVTDAWIDRSEHIIRYLEVTAGSGGAARQVLVPWNFCVVRKSDVFVLAIRGNQFADVPPTKSTSEITRLEEEKILGYFGAGLLYAKPSRTEPLI